MSETFGKTRNDKDVSGSKSMVNERYEGLVARIALNNRRAKIRRFTHELRLH